jgi:hypothetical protein
VGRPKRSDGWVLLPASHVGLVPAHVPAVNANRQNRQVWCDDGQDVLIAIRIVAALLALGPKLSTSMVNWLVYHHSLSVKTDATSATTFSSNG